MIYGADVSSYQPEHFPLTVSGHPVSFVFIKATQGTSYVNPRMKAQTEWARAHGLAVGFYHFQEKGNVAAQAEYFVTKCVSVPGDMLACDWETNPATKTFPSNMEKDQFLAAIKKLRPTAHKVGLYANLDFWLHRDTTSQCGDFLWIADPSAPVGQPRIRHPWLFHQYGISGGEDTNVGKFADLTALKSWCGYPAPVPSGPTVKDLVAAVAASEATLKSQIDQANKTAALLASQTAIAVKTGATLHSQLAALMKKAGL